MVQLTALTLTIRNSRVFATIAKGLRKLFELVGCASKWKVNIFTKVGTCTPTELLGKHRSDFFFLLRPHTPAPTCPPLVNDLKQQLATNPLVRLWFALALQAKNMVSTALRLEGVRKGPRFKQRSNVPNQPFVL